MALVIENAQVVTLEKQRPVLEKQQLVIDRGVIAEMGRRIQRPERFRIERRVDCTGKIVMPGLVNTHSHLTEILQRSFRDNVRMESWRGYRALTEDKACLTPKEIGAAARLACSEMLKNGVTAVVDHFSTRPGLSVAKMEAILGAFEETGMRGVLAASLRDQDFLRLINRPRKRNSHLARSEEPWRDEVLAVLERLRKTPGNSALMLGPSSPLNCSDSLLREVVRLAEQHDLGIHTHLLETRLQRWAAFKLHRKGLVEHLHHLDFLSPRLSAAHSIWLDEREIDLVASSGASVVHNPASNLKLGSGIAPVIKLKRAGVNVALGTDGGDTSDTYSIFDQMRLAALLSRLTAENSKHWVTAFDALRMGTINGAEAVPAWRKRIGKVKPGYCADLLILKPALGLYPVANVIHELIFCERGQSVDMVLVDGQIVVEQGRLTRVDEESVKAEVMPISKKMRRIYDLIKKSPNKAELSLHKLYRQAFASGARRSLANEAS